MVDVAFAGKMAVGKTTLANYLVKEYGYSSLSFAAGVYRVAKTIFGMKDKDRDLLQKIGMKMREVDSLVWIKLLFRVADVSCGPFVIDDCRFLNEVSALRNHDWFVIKVYCDPDVQLGRLSDLYSDVPAECFVHPSETELDDYSNFDYFLWNNGPLDETILELEKILGLKNNGHSLYK